MATYVTERWSTMLLTYQCYFCSSKADTELRLLYALSIGLGLMQIHREFMKSQSHLAVNLDQNFHTLTSLSDSGPYLKTSPSVYFLYILISMLILKVYLVHSQQIKCQSSANWITLSLHKTTENTKLSNLLGTQGQLLNVSL